jgi:hypothetical protein
MGVGVRGLLEGRLGLAPQLLEAHVQTQDFNLWNTLQHAYNL